MNPEEIEKIAELVVRKLLSDKVDLTHAFMAVNKTADDVLMYHRLAEVADIDKVRMTGPPSQYQPNPTAQGAGNRVTFPAYTFIPKSIEGDGKYPLLVLPHGGVHSNFGSGSANVVRELMAQEYIVIAPEYRGSTGYGRGFYELIDYGGLESEDTFEARKFMVENCELVDPKRVGIMGFSHGGMHTLFNIFNHPEAYQAAHASVPVSDIVARMGYKSQYYRDLFEARYHIGKSALENVNEYRRRSPAWNAKKLEVPLLIHTTRNDQDVNVLEVEHLIKSLIAAGNVPEKDFWYKVYPPTPGAHGFSRLDTKFSKGVRGEIYDFLAKYLKPPKPNPLNKYIGTPNPLG
jgi:dipeptidyl aminopeptidase/acylaminoacyl peptidase